MVVKEFELKYKPLRRNSQDTDVEENEFVLNYDPCLMGQLIGY
jgi:hypothetical protein